VAVPGQDEPGHDGLEQHRVERGDIVTVRSGGGDEPLGTLPESSSQSDRK
jgi:hypothetical protein